MTPEPVRPDPTLIPDSVPALSYVSLGLGMLRELVPADSSAFVSPLGAGMALSMAYNGATANTEREIGKLLGIGNLSRDQVNAANQSLREAASSGGVELSIANGVWAQQGMPFTPEYIERVRGAYGAEVATVDFGNPATPERIDAWVARATGDRIRTLVQTPMKPLVVLYLANAVYFKGRWAEEFRRTATRDLPFLFASGTRSPRPTMHRSGRYGYLDGDGFSAVRLPYRGERMAMYVFLPDSGSSLDAFRRTVTPERWEEWMTGFARRQVDVALPRFSAEGNFSLVEPLKRLGMRDAFDGSASFRAMLPESYFQEHGDIFVSDAVQKTWIEVNEEGTEAAAATGIELSTRSMASRSIPFVVDRPFLAAVRDDHTGAILFIGQVTDPR